ncbi:MAG: chromate efflux transporter [Gammaproteobacteria bacterium]|nr:chromate efflux transporter [Gammaproteobacteria bacterium]
MTISEDKGADSQPPVGATPSSNAISFKSALWFWLKLGFISFGGPAGQISVMHEELVERRRWLGERRFLHALNYTMLLPGPEAQQLATYVGWLMHGTWGGLVAGVFFVLPSLAILIALSWIYLVYGDVAIVGAVLFGIKPAVTAIVLFAAYRIGSRVLTNPLLWGIALAGFVAIFALAVPFPAIVLGAALVGYFGGRWRPAFFAVDTSHHGDGQSYGPAVIDDDTELPAHARFSLARCVRFIAVGALLGLGGFALIVAAVGWENALATMAVFFTKAAFLTFGGAYAVLPYVYQGVVDAYQWLTGPQMIDGLALGETTPGPLIMIVAFVGFLAGWGQAVLGPDALFWGGVAGACIATFFTFLPSFLFIFVGGPLVEATRGDLQFVAPLTAITAVVVGVIVNLALFFAYHVLWPAGFEGRLEWVALGIGVLAFVALFRLRIGIIPVIVASGAAGLAYSTLIAS